MKTEIRVLEKPKLDNPLFIEGLPGIGNVGRVAAGYLIDEIKAKKFAELYSRHFLPFVLVHDNAEIYLLKNEFYYYKAKSKKERDLVILVGDSQSLDPVGHYEIVWKVLEFASELGCKEIVTLGGFGTGNLDESNPKVIGAVSHEEIKKKYEKHGINFNVAGKLGTIVGASGLLLGLGKFKEMKGVCVMAETAGFPIVTDPKAAEAVLKVVASILGMDMDMSKLDKRVEEMEQFIKKIETMQRKAIEEISQKKEGKDEQTRYIG